MKIGSVFRFLLLANTFVSVLNRFLMISDLFLFDSCD